ncbi:MAG: hypothetical protein SGARI_004241 [Bacillariaceae sp.]
MYIIASLYVAATGLASVLEVFLDIPCDDPGKILEFENPAYDGSRCPHIRYAVLMGLCKEECSFARRLVASIILGGLIGWERRQADRPAAAIPSGVGFLGAGLIFKKEEKDNSLVVHGLTTAASVWISASVGIACGGELYFAASFGVAIMMLLLRFGPRSFDTDDDEYDEENVHDEMETKTLSERGLKTVVFATDTTHKQQQSSGNGRGADRSPDQSGAGSLGYGTQSSLPGQQEETASLLSNPDGGSLTGPRRRDTKSTRKRAALASVV